MARDMTSRLAAKDRRLIPGIFKGVKPPAGIKKQDRLETSLGPIVNTKKLYLRKNMTELVDEFFEHPFQKNDDIMDALYYADYYSRAPSSGIVSAETLEKRNNNSSLHKKMYNWMTGMRI
jgi:hypothetical protein